MNDDELMTRVRGVFELLDPVPEHVLAAGSSAYRHRLPDAALAELTDDHGGAPAGARGAGDRLLTFAGPGLTVELEVCGTGRGRELTGQLSPATSARLQVRHPAGRLTGRVDPAGRFTIAEVPSGLVSLVFLLPDATSIVTSWVRV